MGRFGWRSGVTHAKGYKGQNKNVLADKVWIPSNELSLQTSGTAATAGQVDDSHVLLFDQTADEDANYTMLLPDWTNSSLKVLAELYWSSSDTAGNDVVWDIEYGAFADGEDIDMSSPTNVSVTDTDSSTANALNISDAFELSSNVTAGDLLVMHLFRDTSESADDLAADAALRGISLEIREV